MSFKKIRSTLVNAFVTGGFGMPCAYENRAFEPDKSQPWSALTVIPNQPSVATLGQGGADNHDGIMQIDLNYPLDQGDVDALDKADEIHQVFKAGTNLIHDGQTVTVRSCGRSTGRMVDDMYRIVMTITWYARTTR